MSLDHNPAVSPDLLLYEDAVRNGLRTRAELVLANLKEEGVLDDELSAEGGRTTLGCAIILYRAAIESTTNPPAISLPSTTGRQSITLSQESCPRALRTFISVWSQITPAIIALSSEHLEDVRRLLFGMHPLSTTCDPHLEAIVRMLEMVAFVLGTWCMRRDPPAGSHASAPIGSPAPEVDASGCKDEPSSMPRTKRQLRKSENASPSTDRPSKHPRKDPAFRQAILANGKTDDPHQSSKKLPAELVSNSSARPHVQVKWSSVISSNTGARTPLPLPLGRRPVIWAANRNELCAVLPEMGQAQNNIAFENTQTPVLFIDEACDESDRWDGGKTIHLTMTRRFEFQASPALLQQSLSHALPTPSQPIVDAPPERATDAPELDQDVVYKDGFYVYTNEVDEPVAQLSSASNEEHANSTALSDVCSLLLENAPTEICALIRARESRVPVNVILSRGAGIAAFAFPDGCGCAYLGFFFITKIGVTRSPYSLGANAEEPCIYGTMSWTLDLDWTPGGEDPDALVASNCLPWWMQDHSKASEHDVDPTRSEPGKTILIDKSGVPLQHPYTLLPLHFLAPSSRMGGDIKGWHCGTCGRLNVQRNLCTQRCGSCSTFNHIPPIAVEHVRPSRGTDPITFPWNRHAESVNCSSSDAPDGLLRFTYKLTKEAFVHHMFSRNHTAVQAQPTQLFFELQVGVELVAEPVAKVGRGAPSVVYAASFGGTTKNTKPTDLWSSDVPSCVSRARGLMLHRGKLETSTSAVVINRLVIWAWRTSGNRKGLTLDAAQSPVVILCLGADVELTFFCPREPDARRTAHRHKAKSSKKVVGTGYEIDGDYQDEKHATRSVAKKRATGQRGQHAEEALTTTLVHGDLLVMEGVVFEYTLKKTGMSILLIGSQL